MKQTDNAVLSYSSNLAWINLWKQGKQMVSTVKPDWLDEWVVIDYDGWHLKSDAPAEIKKKFEDYMKEILIDIGDNR